MVRRDSTFLLQKRFYEAPAHLAGQKVEVRFDPLDPSQVDVYFGGLFQGAARLGVAHTDESCPLVILRVMDEAGETEIAGSFDHVLSLAQWISRVCDITPCIANGVIQATREASRRAAG